MATDLNGKSFKAFIKYAFEKAKRRYSVSDENLYNNGTVYYMNGNDGTDFDWNMNDMLCEFYIFHKESEMGYIKLSVKRDGKYWVYIYEDGAYKPIMSYEGNVSEYFGYEYESEEIALNFANLMYEIADSKNKYDKPIDELDWNVDTSTLWYLNDEEEEDIYEDDDEDDEWY